MKYNISCIFKNRAVLQQEKGQTLIEFIIVYPLLFLCAFAVVEVARFLAFKICLQATTSYVAHKIAYSQINLIQKNILFTQNSVYENKDKNFLEGVSREIESHLNKISTTLLSYDYIDDNANKSGVFYLNKHHISVRLKSVYNSQREASGVYIESQACLPVLFSSYFRHIRGEHQVGKAVQNDSRTCLGHFNSSKSLPLFWFRARVAAFSPWPAATQIFYSGLALPAQFEVLEQVNKEDIVTSIKSHKLTQFFIPVKNTRISGWQNEW